MLVYDITNEKSFDNIRNWIRNIEEVRLEGPSTNGNFPLALSSILTLEPPGLQMGSLRHRDTHEELVQSGN